MALLVLLTACATGGRPSATAASGPSGTVVVFAAASLNNAFTAVGEGFHGKYPAAQVQFNFAGSPTLVTQLTQGARADVLATADSVNMGKASDAGLLRGGPVLFAHNLLEIAVAPGNPKHIATLGDLGRPDVTLVLAAPEVPAGKYAVQALAKAGVTARPKSLETDVESVLTKVELGEADAGIVYTTDVRAAGSKVRGVQIPAAQNVIAGYPVALLKDAPNLTGAAAFIAYLRSPAGREVLQRYGFQAT